ncbi:hypothetical protein [Aminobacter aminovorans]|jgi:hypothetical protein|uniref:Uncharacterized protein n=1 Tax=Aminobacter aminovorans TaxID=83263 RepID=A0AAC9FDV4_AMIAI|nr:hypothetical protein [Aminobacter aminovorans]AMS42242.1 hypothetical protein AA2016_3320 [Aminobacter aminovorans]MBB3709603.1 hypothetical protein [Aminobacter aminovorans]
MDWAVAISAAAQAIGIVKDLREIDKGFDHGELKARMADLYINLADVRMALVDAQEEARAKDADIAKLKVNFQFRATLVEERGFKYERLENGEAKGLPFCPRCEQNKAMFYRLTPNSKGYRGSYVRNASPYMKTWRSMVGAKWQTPRIPFQNRSR